MKAGKTASHKSRRPSLREGERYVKIIVEENPDITENELVAFLKLIGWKSKQIKASKKRLERLMKDRKENHQPEERRIGNCVLQVSRFYRKFPESSDEAVRSFIKLLAGSNGLYSECTIKVQSLHESTDNKVKHELSKIEAMLNQEAAPKRHPIGPDAKDIEETLFSRLKTWLVSFVHSDRSLKGPKGDAGKDGVKGDAGKDGVKGEKGDKGDTGKDGVKGEKGDKGDAGKDGVKGEKGDKGDAGKDGVKGDKGDAGKNGMKGEKGDKGDAGMKGEKGDKGDAGINGVKGECG